MDDLIKVKVKLKKSDDMPASENVWAKRLSEDTAEILNIPFFIDKFCLGDIVQIKESKNGVSYKKTIKKVSSSCFLSYKKGKNYKHTQKNYADIVEYMAKHKIQVEGAVPGVAMLAYPIEMSEFEVDEIISDAPHLIERAVDL